MIQKIIKFCPLIAIIVFSLILRIIKLEELFYFTYDESVFAFVGRRFALWHHIPLIGGATPFGFHVAPYFYWFFGLTLTLGNLNPIIWGFISALLGLATTVMMFIVGKTFSNKKVAITAAILWAFSFFANIYDRHFWGLTFGPLFSLLVIYCLFKIVKKNEKYAYILGILLALIIHADLSYYVFILLSVVVWFVFKIPVKKSALIALLFIVVSFVPLIIFDIRHNFSNTHPALNFFKQGRNNPGFNFDKFKNNTLLFPNTFSREIYSFSDNEVSKYYSYCPNYVREKFTQTPMAFLLFSSIFLIFFTYWSLKLNKNSGWKIISIFLLIYFGAIQLYGTVFKADIFEHYLTGIFAPFLLALALFVASLPKKIWLFVLGLFLTFNLLKLTNAQNLMGLTQKRQAIEYVTKEIGAKPFSLDSLSTCWKYNGYRYLFTVFGNEPVKSYVDPNFAYLYGATPVWEKHPKDVVSFAIHDYQPETSEFYKRYNWLKLHQTKTATFGNIEVIIMDNSSGWFDQPQTLKNPSVPASVQ